MRPMRIGAAIAALVLLAAVTIVFVTPAGDHVSSTLAAQSLNCDMSQYKATSGLTATIEQGALAVTWGGTNGSELRARYAIDNGQPVVRELAVRKSGGQWAPLGQNLIPEFYVKSGVRRMTTQQGAPLRDLGVDITARTSCSIAAVSPALDLYCDMSHLSVSANTTVGDTTVDDEVAKKPAATAAEVRAAEMAALLIFTVVMTISWRCPRR